MCGISHKMLLRLKRLMHTLQQAVELCHQRAHFIGQTIGADRGKVLRLAQRQFAPHSLHRRQRLANHPPHSQCQQRQQQNHGQQAAQRGFAGQQFAHAHVLRNLNNLRSGLQ